MAGPQRRLPLVGRQAELQALLRQLADAGRGAGGLALLAGEPGIGKTHLVAELAERARRDGWCVLTGQAYDTAGMPPYLPFREALQPYLRDGPPDALTAQLGGDAAELAGLLPELRARLPHLTALPPATPAEARYRLFEAVSDVLLRIARAPGRAGLLLCLDDLHWADEATLLLLEHLGRRLAGAPLLVAVAYRDTEVRLLGAVQLAPVLPRRRAAIQRRLQAPVHVPPPDAEHGRLAAGSPPPPRRWPHPPTPARRAPRRRSAARARAAACGPGRPPQR